MKAQTQRENRKSAFLFDAMVQLAKSNILKQLEGYSLQHSSISICLPPRHTLQLEQRRDIHANIRTTLHFHNSAITKPVVCARMVVEMGSHLTRMIPGQSHNCFLNHRSQKSLCDFTGTIFEQCETPVIILISEPSWCLCTTKFPRGNFSVPLCPNNLTTI